MKSLSGNEGSKRKEGSMLDKEKMKGAENKQGRTKYVASEW